MQEAGDSTALVQNRPELHFTGHDLISKLSPIDLVREVKSETDVPEFLRLSADISKDPDQIKLEEDSLATTCLFTEITLKSANYTPVYPLRAPEPILDPFGGTNCKQYSKNG